VSSPLAPSTAAPGAAAPMSPSVERQRSRPRSAPRRTRRRRACVRVGLGREKRKGVEDLYSSCSRKRRRRRLSEKRRPPHLGNGHPAPQSDPSRSASCTSDTITLLATYQGWLGSRPAPSSCLQVDISNQSFEVFFFALLLFCFDAPPLALSLFPLCPSQRSLSLTHTHASAAR
jgi:hypothetical protein